MGFWSLYWPIFAAFVSTTLLFEGIHLVLSIIINQRQLQQLKEQTRVLMEQGGVQGFPGGGNLPFTILDNNAPMYGRGPVPPTASGTTIEHGHYL